MMWVMPPDVVTMRWEYSTLVGENDENWREEEEGGEAEEETLSGGEDDVGGCGDASWEKVSDG